MEWLESKKDERLILVIDVGNSRLKWGFAEHGELITSGEDLHPSRLSSFATKHWVNEEKPTSVVISNVGKASLGDRIRQWVVRHWEIEPYFIASESERFGIKNGYAEPSQLGSDRWAALIAARQITDSPVVIVDCGSAITIDVLNEGGLHMGGLIVPGLEMMRGALEAKAERIKLSALQAQLPTFLARDTKGAVIGGTLYSAVASIDRISHDVGSELGIETEYLITGGDAPQFLPLLSGKYKHYSNLVLEGLIRIAQGEE